MDPTIASTRYQRIQDFSVLRLAEICLWISSLSYCSGQTPSVLVRIWAGNRMTALTWMKRVGPRKTSRKACVSVAILVTADLFIQMR